MNYKSSIKIESLFSNLNLFLLIKKSDFFFPFCFYIFVPRLSFICFYFFIFLLNKAMIYW